MILSTQVVKQNCTSFCATLRCMHTKRKLVVDCVAWYAQAQTNKQTLKFFLSTKNPNSENQQISGHVQSCCASVVFVGGL